MQKVPKDWIERTARVYASNQAASSAPGIANGAFGRLCRLHDIETPFARQRRRRNYGIAKRNKAWSCTNWKRRRVTRHWRVL